MRAICFLLSLVATVTTTDAHAWRPGSKNQKLPREWQLVQTGKWPRHKTLLVNDRTKAMLSVVKVERTRSFAAVYFEGAAKDEQGNYFLVRGSDKFGLKVEQREASDPEIQPYLKRR